MKNACFCLVFYSSALTFYGQSAQGGIYATHEDLIQSKLSFAFECSSSKNKIVLNTFPEKPYITVFKNGEKLKFNKKEIFAHRDCNGRVYRWYQAHTYEVLNSTSICLYKQEMVRAKSGEFEKRYYFSKGINSPIFPLTFDALKRAFRNEPVFCEALQSRFRSEEELMTIDGPSKQYHLIQLYIISQKQQN